MLLLQARLILTGLEHENRSLVAHEHSARFLAQASVGRLRAGQWEYRLFRSRRSSGFAKTHW